jgi:hypothetical protein
MYITATVVFQSWDEATRAEDDLLAAGYITLIIPEKVSDYGSHTWMHVSRPTDLTDDSDPRLSGEWDQLYAAVDTLRGFVEEFGLDEKTVEFEIDPVTRQRLFPQIARYPHH